VMEQRSVIRFLTLKKLFARDITDELEGMDGHEAPSLSAAKNGRTELVNGRITLGDDPGSGRTARSDLCESSRVLVDETLFISCKCMCQKLRFLKTTCLRIFHKDLGLKKCYLRWVLHSITENEAQCQVTMSE
jgi:hypothetical protein